MAMKMVELNQNMLAVRTRDSKKIAHKLLVLYKLVFVSSVHLISG